MSISFKCPGCQKEYSVSDSHAGEDAQCAGCRYTFQIPQKQAECTRITKQNIFYNCPSCGTNLYSPVSKCNKEDTCPDCDYTFTVPSKMISYKCQACSTPLLSNLSFADKTDICPNCGAMCRVPQTSEQRKAARAQERARQVEEKLVEENKRKTELERQQAAMKRYQAVLAGKIFDVDILVEEFKNDFIQLQKDTGLTPVQISEGTKAASPVVGIGTGWAAGNLWVGLIAGVITALVSGPLAQGYARLKFEEWKQKWYQIFSNCSAQQFMDMTDALKDNYPMVFSSVFGFSKDCLMLE